MWYLDYSLRLRFYLSFVHVRSCISYVCLRNCLRRTIVTKLVRLPSNSYQWCNSQCESRKRRVRFTKWPSPPREYRSHGASSKKVYRWKSRRKIMSGKYVHRVQRKCISATNARYHANFNTSALLKLAIYAIRYMMTNFRLRARYCPQSPFISGTSDDSMSLCISSFACTTDSEALAPAWGSNNYNFISVLHASYARAHSLETR